LQHTASLFFVQTALKQN